MRYAICFCFLLVVCIIGLGIRADGATADEAAKPFSVAPPPGGRAVAPEQQLLGENIVVREYECMLSQNEAEGFYRDLLGREGFVQDRPKDVREGLWRRLKFTRGSETVELRFYNRAGKSLRIATIYYNSAQTGIPDLKEELGRKGGEIELPFLRKEGQSSVKGFFPAQQGKGFLPPDAAIPAPGKSRAVENEKLKAMFPGRKVATYSSQLKSGEIESFYRSFFGSYGIQSEPSAGFSLGFIKRLVFKQPGRVVEVVLLDSFGGTDVALIEGAQGDSAQELAGSLAGEIKLKEEDEPGEDIQRIPRPPKSVRQSYYVLAGNNGEHALYSSSLSRQELVDFYLGAMPGEGWELQGHVSMKDVQQRYEKIQGKKSPPLFKLEPLPIFDLSRALEESEGMVFSGEPGRAQLSFYPSFIEEGKCMVDISLSPTGGTR